MRPQVLWWPQVGGSTLSYSDDLAVAQDGTLEIGEDVQTFVVEFDQSAYEAYLSGHGTSKATHGCWRICAKERASARSPTACFLHNNPQALASKLGVPST